MSRIYIDGVGAVSPAGWGMEAMRAALEGTHTTGGIKQPETSRLPRPGREEGIAGLRVPPPASRPSYLAHPRLRRSSAISQYAMGAVSEAIASSKTAINLKKTGVVVCVYSGSVNYSRRFYDETLKDPSTASPLVFPETVFNAPASHISAYLGSSAINYTVVGDAGTFLVAMAMAANWIADGRVNSCIVAGSEELDWLTAEALRLFDREKITSEGAGAIILTREKTGVELLRITDEKLYAGSGKERALTEMRKELGNIAEDILLCDSTAGERGICAAENALWRNWAGPRIAPRRALGEGLMAAAAWQCAFAADRIHRGRSAQAMISIAGLHQHAIGGVIGRAEEV